MSQGFDYRVVDATIASGAALSGSVQVQDVARPSALRALVGIQMPDGWTTASLTFDVSLDGSTFVPLYWDGSEYEIVAAGGAAASSGVALEPSVFAGWAFVKVRSGTSGTPVNQGAERVLKLVLRGV